MIGFERELAREGGHQNEGPETRNLEKKQLYELLALKYFLAPYGSRGIDRKYLLAVYNNNVFRVGNSDIRRFEVELQPMMCKKIGVLNNALLLRKLNFILDSRRQSGLGFSDFDPPDQVG